MSPTRSPRGRGRVGLPRRLVVRLPQPRRRRLMDRRRNHSHQPARRLHVSAGLTHRHHWYHTRGGLHHHRRLLGHEPARLVLVLLVVPRDAHVRQLRRRRNLGLETMTMTMPADARSRSRRGRRRREPPVAHRPTSLTDPVRSAFLLLPLLLRLGLLLVVRVVLVVVNLLVVLAAVVVPFRVEPLGLDDPRPALDDVDARANLDVRCDGHLGTLSGTLGGTLGGTLAPASGLGHPQRVERRRDWAEDLLDGAEPPARVEAQYGLLVQRRSVRQRLHHDGVAHDADDVSDGHDGFVRADGGRRGRLWALFRGDLVLRSRGFRVAGIVVEVAVHAVLDILEPPRHVFHVQLLDVLVAAVGPLAGVVAVADDRRVVGRLDAIRAVGVFAVAEFVLRAFGGRTDHLAVVIVGAVVVVFGGGGPGGGAVAAVAVPLRGGGRFRRGSVD
mmetsp:Transcript_4771/g.19606  ORF Transcript_4771/g.19606 Transcript_4771/m.19606 type:complete len:443 (-) Transcript_4771:173-1501(-)